MLVNQCVLINRRKKIRVRGLVSPNSRSTLVLKLGLKVEKKTIRFFEHHGENCDRGPKCRCRYILEMFSLCQLSLGCSPQKGPKIGEMLKVGHSG